MSRGDREPERDPPAEGTPRSNPERHDRPTRVDLARDASPAWSAARTLTLPDTRHRQPVRAGRKDFRLRASDSELLATVGTFRVVAERDIVSREEHSSGRDASNSQASPTDVRSLIDQGLLESRTIVMNQQSERVLVLTRHGEDLLEANRSPDDRTSQRFYSGLVKPRELAHDAQLYRLFDTERRQLEDAGNRITRVVLDYELKREYHRFVHRRRGAGFDPGETRQAFAAERNLPFSNGRIELPDVRIEYQTPDGLTAYRDLELATEHYSRSQLSGKLSTGFRVYRAAGVRGASAGRSGGTPSDPHHLEWLR